MLLSILISVLIFTGLLDICLSNDSYQPHQKQLLFSWKQKVGTIWQTLPSLYQPNQHQQKTPKLWHHNSTLSRRSSLQNWHKCPISPGIFPVRHPSNLRDNLANIPHQYPKSFYHRRSVPNIKFSSSYPNSVNLRSNSVSATERKPLYSQDYFGYKIGKEKCPDPKEIEKSIKGTGYSFDDYHLINKLSKDDPNLSEAELDTRMESLCLSVTDYALGLDK